MKATNVVGDGPWSSIYQFLIVDKPSEPLNPKIEEFENTYVTLSWEQPLYNGGQALTGFQVYRQECSDSLSAPIPLLPLALPLPASQFEYTDTSVTGGLQYCFHVTAVNALGGESEKSVDVQVTPISIPSGLLAPTLVTRTLTSLTVQWYPPASDGDSEVERYILLMKAEFESQYRQVYSGKSLSYTAAYLQTGFNYQFKVRAVNARGTSDPSPASASFITALKPSVPLNLKLVSRSKSAITFSWEPPTDKGGLELTGYKVYVAEGSNAYLEVSTAPTRLNPTLLTHTQAGLTAGVAYKFKVSAYNPIGEGLQTDHLYVIAADMPQAPVNPPTVLELTQTSITIRIDPIQGPADGGSSVTGYIVMIDDGLGGDFTQVQDSLNLELTISNLRSGRSYRIKYAGRNRVYD